MELSKFTVNRAKSTQLTHPHPKSHEICAIHTNFLRFSVPTSKIVKFHDICVLLYFCRFRAFHTGSEITQGGANSAKFAMY